MQVDGKANIYVADLTGQISVMKSLRISGDPILGCQPYTHLNPSKINLGRRGNPASYPNRDVEGSLFPDGWVNVSSGTHWVPPKPPKTEFVSFNLSSPVLTDKTLFQHYQVC
jgi:hypothetical protein